MCSSMAKATREKIVLVLVVLSLIFVYGATTPLARKYLTELEIRKEIKHLNKPTIKSIKSEDGDIIDCVDIHKQPAFDHPLLKNHTIQMRPSFYDSKRMSSLEPLEQLWHKSGSCPEGTIPIRRIRKEDSLRTISSKVLETTLPSQIDRAKMLMEGENHGAEASINAWNVHVEPSEFSAASVYVLKKNKPDFVNAGWIISQNIMGDNSTRLFARWGADAGAGCYNLKCSGFVQITHKFSLGATLTPLSTYDGKPYWIFVRISMDPADGHWWLVIQEESVGYWPSSLFKNMVGSADLIEWSGEVLNSEPENEHTSTQMGSGHFSKEGYKKSAFFDNCVYLVKHDDARIPNNVYLSATSPKCYDISEASRARNKGLFFYYGGPGGPICDI